jgi:biofilm PGA synthesis N-glycosyltransferase PgaC
MRDMPRYSIITPVRDEAPYIERTLASVIHQSILPVEWIIVDDGSTDGTGEILDRYSAQTSWIRVVHRTNRGYRAAGGGVMEAFRAGYSVLSDHRWDFIVKLDGDLSFPSDYFELSLYQFMADDKLGIGGGTVCKLRSGELEVDSVGDPPFHVRGATKIYRRACWEQICPLVEGPGWDTIDEVKANMRGWTTRTFVNLKVIQHKPTGGASGNWNNWLKNGRANYIAGYHPLFMFGKCMKRAFRASILVESVALMGGFLSGYIKGVSQAPDKETIRYLRDQQIRHILFRRSIYG